MYDELAKTFKVLSDRNRLLILHLLRNQELCACELEDYLNITQSGLSYHMKQLVESGLVLKRPEGSWIHYRINEKNRDVAALVEKLIEKAKLKV